MSQAGENSSHRAGQRTAGSAFTWLYFLMWVREDSRKGSRPFRQKEGRVGKCRCWLFDVRQ